MKNAISARSELRFGGGVLGCSDREEAEEEREKTGQPGTEEAEVVAGGGEDDVDGVAGGAGSDHTDRRVEAYSIPVSKQMCPKPIARDLWPIEEVEPHWDELIVASEIEERGGFVTYQRGTAEAMRHPRDILAHAARQGVPHGPGTLIFGGTLPVIGGIRPARRFRYRLEDPRLGRRIEGVYETQEL